MYCTVAVSVLISCYLHSQWSGIAVVITSAVRQGKQKRAALALGGIAIGAEAEVTRRT